MFSIFFRLALFSLLFVTITSRSRLPCKPEYVEVSENKDETRSIFNGANIEDVLNHQITGENYCLLIKDTQRNFSSPNRTISEIKCLEYTWQARVHENMNNYIADCSVTTGGRPAFQGELPHMGAVGWRSADKGNNISKWIFKCGASLISEKFMLTAAHCSSVPKRDTTVANTKPEIVKIGDKFLIESDIFKLMSTLSGEEISTDFLANYIRIERFIKHDNYESPKVYYDIALLELAESLQFNSRIRPICLWGSEESDPEEDLSISGWGVVNMLTRESTTELQVANITIIDTDECNELLKCRRNRNWQGLTGHQICAGHLAGGIDTCEGDSGGPLQAKINLSQEWHMYYLVGVTSFGYSCALPNVPSVYTRTASFIDWIENIVWPDVKEKEIQL